MRKQIIILVEKNKPKSRDTHFFPSAHYPNINQTKNKTILHHRYELEFVQLRNKILNHQSDFDYRTVAKTTIADLKAINMALTTLRQNGDKETRLEFNEIFSTDFKPDRNLRDRRR